MRWWGGCPAMVQGNIEKEGGTLEQKTKTQTKIPPERTLVMQRWSIPFLSVNRKTDHRGTKGSQGHNAGYKITNQPLRLKAPHAGPKKVMGEGGTEQIIRAPSRSQEHKGSHRSIKQVIPYETILRHCKINLGTRTMKKIKICKRKWLVQVHRLSNSRHYNLPWLRVMLRLG